MPEEEEFQDGVEESGKRSRYIGDPGNVPQLAEPKPLTAAGVMRTCQDETGAEFEILGEEEKGVRTVTPRD
jgi:hypothetical protein